MCLGGKGERPPEDASDGVRAAVLGIELLHSAGMFLFEEGH